MNNEKKDLPHDAAGTDSHELAADVAAELHHSVAPPPPLEEAIAAPPAGTDPPAPPAPPPPPSAPKKTLEDWARAKGVHPLVTGTNRKTGKPILVPNRNLDKHHYAGMLAKWHWVPTMEVTEAEFDEEFVRVKHGLVLGPYPHPKSVAAVVSSRLKMLVGSTLLLSTALLAPHGALEHGAILAALPDVVTTIQDFSLGIVPPSSSNAAALIGPCTGGTINTLYAFNDPTTLVSTLISGAAVELAAYMLSQPGHGTVYVVPVNCSVAGTVGAPAYTRIAASTGTCIASGAPLDQYNILVTIAFGEATVAGGGGIFTYSMDNGFTTSQQIAIPTGGVYAIPGTGITLTFAGAATAFTSGDLISFACVSPYYSGSDFTTAFNALQANGATWRFCVAVGSAASATAAATFATTFGSLMNGAQAANRSAYGMVQCNDTDANCETAFANFANNRVVVAGGQEYLTSQINGRVFARDAIWVAAARIATRPVSEDAGRVATGSLVGIVSLLRDESKTSGLDAARFITLRTLSGEQGFYITNGWTMEPFGGDYCLLQNRQVMDVACTAARAANLQFLNETLRVNGPNVASPLVPGGIYILDAQRIQTAVNSAIRVALNIGAPGGLSPTGDASASSVVVNQATNVIATETIPETIRVVPMGYGKFITENIGLQNPALTQAV